MSIIVDYSNIFDMIDGDNLIDEYGTEWRRLWNYPGYYVSEDGRVASTRKGYIHVLKTWPNQCGHQYVGLWFDGPSGRALKRESVHRLVASAFVYNRNPKENNVVRHLDDDPTNNDASNLAWGTQADNHRDCVEHGREYSKAVYCLETGRVYRSCAEAAADFGVSKSLITLCCQGKVHAVKDGHHLCYLDDKDYKENHIDEWTFSTDLRKPVIAVNLSTGEEAFFESRNEAAAKLNLNSASITNVLHGRLKRTGNWTFKEWKGE